MPSCGLPVREGAGDGWCYGSVPPDRAPVCSALSRGLPLSPKCSAMRGSSCGRMPFPKACPSPYLTLEYFPLMLAQRPRACLLTEDPKGCMRGDMDACLGIWGLVRVIAETRLRNLVGARILGRIKRPCPVEAKHLASKSVRAPAGLSSGWRPSTHAPGWLSMPS